MLRAWAIGAACALTIFALWPAIGPADAQEMTPPVQESGAPGGGEGQPVMRPVNRTSQQTSDRPGERPQGSTGGPSQSVAAPSVPAQSGPQVPADARPMRDAAPATGAGQVTATGGGPVPEAPAPASALLIVDQDALYRASAWGQRAQAELEARSREVSAENDRIAAALEAEDDALTALRATLPPDEFRRRADAFDARVQQVRKDRDQAGRMLIEMADQDRGAFLAAALPLFTALMRERGAAAILDRRTVFLSAEAVDITQTMIERIDQNLGAGPVTKP